MALSVRQQDGSTLRDHLVRVQEVSGIRDARLDVDIPDGGEQLWATYWELRRDAVVTYAEIDAYCRLRGVVLAGWEVAAIREIDAAVVEVLTDG